MSALQKGWYFAEHLESIPLTVIEISLSLMATQNSLFPKLSEQLAIHYRDTCIRYYSVLTSKS